MKAVITRDGRLHGGALFGNLEFLRFAHPLELQAASGLHNTTVAKIKSWNRIRGNVISAGDRLRILAAKRR